MIKGKNLFILGAGSSKPYGFPTGPELRERITLNFYNKYESSFGEPIPRTSVRAAKDFVNAFYKSHVQSIDKFLLFRPEFLDYGKRAIAIEILESENKNNLSQGDWYFYLFNRMVEDLSSSADAYQRFKENEIDFITFNYDRSLDYYIFNSFQNIVKPALGLPEREDNASYLIPFSFYHVYGAPKLPWQVKLNEPSLEYQYIQDILPHHIEMMANSIQLIDARDPGSKKMTDIHRIMSRAERVFFLGFGFADENLYVLDIPRSIEGKSVYGTAKGYTNTEIKRVREKLSARNPNIHNMDCLSLLREFL